MKEYYRNLNRIEFVVTMACTGRCKHCSEGEHISCKDHIDGSKVQNAIKEVCKRYPITSLMTFGGEPLLHPEDVCMIHTAATEAGISSRQLITNGFFTKDEGRMKEVAHMLKESGVNCVLLSVDAFHQETIPLKPVKFFADQLKAEGVPIYLSPAWLVSMEDDNPYNNQTREILSVFTKEGYAIGEGNVIWPEGNAKKYLAEYFDADKEYVNPYEDDPNDIDTLCFNEKGDVLNGNIYKDDIMKIMDSYSV